MYRKHGFFLAALLSFALIGQSSWALPSTHIANPLSQRVYSCLGSALTHLMWATCAAFGLSVVSTNQVQRFMGYTEIKTKRFELEWKDSRLLYQEHKEIVRGVLGAKYEWYLGSSYLDVDANFAEVAFDKLKPLVGDKLVWFGRSIMFYRGTDSVADTYWQDGSPIFK